MIVIELKQNKKQIVNARNEAITILQSALVKNDLGWDV